MRIITICAMLLGLCIAPVSAEDCYPYPRPVVQPDSIDDLPPGHCIDWYYSHPVEETGICNGTK